MASSHLKRIILILSPRPKRPQGKEIILKWKMRMNLIQNLSARTRMKILLAWEKRPFWYVFRIHVVNYWQFMLGWAWEDQERKAVEEQTSEKKVEEGREARLYTWRNHRFNMIISAVSPTLSIFLRFFPPSRCQICFPCNLLKWTYSESQVNCCIPPSTTHFQMTWYTATPLSISFMSCILIKLHSLLIYIWIFHLCFICYKWTLIRQTSVVFPTEISYLYLYICIPLKLIPPTRLFRI